MGFGLLLCGYFAVTMMAVGMGEFRVIAHLLGGMVSFSAACRLKDYNPRFLWTAVASVGYVLVSLYEGAVLLDNTFLWGVVPVGGAWSIVSSAVLLAVEIAYHVTLLWSVAELSGSLDIPKIRTAAWRNLGLYGVYAVGQGLLMAIPTLGNVENNAIPRLLVLFMLVVYVFTAWMLYGCYQSICPAGEELSKPAKRSRFAFVNKLNDKFDERSARALRESLEYGAEKQARREQKRNGKGRRKKK